MRTIIIEGRRYEWKEIRHLRWEQIQAARPAQFPVFELKEDARHSTQQTVDGRYQEPLLFD
jgi:hypothetical protein